jgi:hypothetical protein
MIHVNYETQEGVCVVVVGLCRWIGTCGGMISLDLHGAKIPQMDVVTPSRGKNISETCTRKKQGCFPWRHSGRHRPGGILLFHLDVDP